MQENERNILLYGRKYGNQSRRDRRVTQPERTGDSSEFPFRPSLLMSAYNAWHSLSQWRTDIRRNEEFVYGDQHSDKVWDYKDNCSKTERQMFVEQGLQPSQYNIIRNVMRTIVGFWANNKTLPTCIAQKDENQAESEVLTATLHALYRKNELWKSDINELTLLLITGLAKSKNIFTRRDGDSDVMNDYVDPFSFFVDNTMKDPRYKDCSLVGCFYDLPVDDISGMFSNGNRERARKVRELYSRYTDRDRITEIVETFTDKRVEGDFFIPPVESYGLGRVIEVWRKESAQCYHVHDYLKGKYYDDFISTASDLQAENMRRIREQGSMGVARENMLLLEWEWGISNFWKFYYLTPHGEVLSEGVNPFWHEQPPFVFEMHEFYVGKIYPFVKDLIDANKQINKLSAISELLVRYSAKSLLLLPKHYISEDDGGVEEIERKMTSFDGVIPYDAKPGEAPPTYINTVAQAFTPLNVVNMYLKLSEQVSGVFGALQGQQPVAGTPAQSFLQQSQNSATSLTGIFEAINSYRTRRDKMNVQLIQQFYDSKRYIYDKDSGKRLLYDPDKVRNIDVEISISENTNTPAYRLMLNDILMQLKKFDATNMLDLRGLVEVGNWPFKDKLLDYLNGREKEMQQAMAQQQGVMPQPGGLPPELAQEIGQYQFDPQVMEQLQQLPEIRN